MAWRVFPKKQRGYLQIPQLRQFWFGGKPKPSFEAPLTTSLNVSRSKGSGTPTFTRASTAYVQDFEGLYKLTLPGEPRFSGARRARNLHAASEDFSAAAWIKSNLTVTSGQVGPDGALTASRLNWSAPGGTCYEANSNGDITESIWLKSNTGSNQTIDLFAAGISTAVTVTTQWQRFSVTVLGSGAGNVSGIRATTSNDILACYPMQEEVTGQANKNPSEYVSTGVLSAPFHGANVDGVKYFDYENGNTVASNVVTEAKGAAISTSVLLGYLAEGARTNRCLQSQVFSNASWVSGGGGVAVADNSIAAPDGTTTADTLTASGASGTLIQDLGVVASAAKTFSIWLKRKTGTGNVDLTMDGGATWTTVAVTASWVRFEKTQTLADEDVGIRLVTSGDEVYAWQAQVETASFASSEIPTTTIAVARNADVLTYPTAGNISETVGSMYAETLITGTELQQYVLAIDNNAGLLDQSGLYNLYDGTTQDGNSASVSRPNTSVQKIAAKWGATTKTTSLNGVMAVTPGTFDGTLGVLSSRFSIAGTEAAGKQLNGTIRNVRIYSRALSDSSLMSMTT